jgi:hypothetical protein
MILFYLKVPHRVVPVVPPHLLHDEPTPIRRTDSRAQEYSLF